MSNNTIRNIAPETGATTSATDKPDPFDLAGLRLDQSFVETAGVKKLLTTVPVGRPHPQDWIRVHPDPAYRENFATIELKDDREFYILTREIVPELIGEFSLVTFFTTINRQGVVRLWPVKLPDPDGKINEWHRSAREAAECAMGQWVRLKANMSLGAYDIFTSPGTIGEPEWPTEPFVELLRTAFRDHRLVDRPDHPLIKRLRGLA
jgi:hypothetical protein